MTKDELEKMHTKSLLARLKRLHRCEQSFELSDWEEHEIDENADYIQFKESAEWIAQRYFEQKRAYRIDSFYYRS